MDEQTLCALRLEEEVRTPKRRWVIDRERRADCAGWCACIASTARMKASANSARRTAIECGEGLARSDTMYG